MRKLIQLSPSTHVVSLPSKWIKKNNLSKGDELQIAELENQVIISTIKKPAQSSITIDLKRLPRQLVWAQCDAAYIAGHDQIIFLHTAEQQEILASVKNEVPGMIVIEQKQESTTFKDITSGKSEDVHSIIVRIMHMISDLLNQASGYAKEKDWKNLAVVKKIDYAINSYISYAQRQINRHGFAQNYSSNLVVTYLKLCETFADLICSVCENNALKKINISNELEKTLIIWRELVSLFLKYDEKKLIALEEQRAGFSSKALSSYDTAQLKTSLFEIIEVIIQINSGN